MLTDAKPGRISHRSPFFLTSEHRSPSLLVADDPPVLPCRRDPPYWNHRDILNLTRPSPTQTEPPPASSAAGRATLPLLSLTGGPWVPSVTHTVCSSSCTHSATHG